MPENFIVQSIGDYYSDWTIHNPTGTAGVYNNNLGGDFASTSSALEVTNLAQRNFILSTTFILNYFGSFSHTYININVAMSVLASGANLLGSGYRLSYELLQMDYGFPLTGSLEFAKDARAILEVPSNTLPVVIGAPYTTTLTGTFTPNGLVLDGTLSNGSDEISATFTDPTPQLGDYFGYYNVADGLTNQGAYVNVDYDNFSINAAPINLLSAALSLLMVTPGLSRLSASGWNVGSPRFTT